MDTSAARRLDPGRLAALACAALLTLVAGRLLVDGITLQERARQESAGSALRIVGGLLLAIAALSWAGGVANRGGTAGRLPFGLVMWVCAGSGLLGGYWANRSGVLLLVIVATSPVAVLSVVLHGRWRGRQLDLERRAGERAAALAARGRPTPGLIIGVEQTGRMYGDDPELRLNVQFTVDGREWSGTASRFYPGYDLPRTGDAVTVHYLPEDPSILDIQENRQPRTPAPPAQPAYRGPELAAELERLARLHRDGALTDAEFSAAKGRLLG
ncbi:DUF3592 domain-containing protein [Micromonospora sp. URMC 106]|jgi:hypothetical protein|uniref:DUF3592 domain-containing protein n=1 Tax=Micromonospora sp. URMC 106 TaxID=3423408 RepID=UPI003F1E2ED1